MTENREEHIDVSNLSFEEALVRLEEIVRQLEDGNLPLEDSLALFECGIRLSRRCRELLESARHRIDVLSEEGELTPFEEENKTNNYMP